MKSTLLSMLGRTTSTFRTKNYAIFEIARNSKLAPVAAILIVSVVIRVLWTFWYFGPIDGEGSEYARIAENLRNGVGYVGIATPGYEVMFPPLYPLLIAGVSFITDDYERASRVISLLFGAALPLIIFSIASSLFDRRSGLVAGFLTALHPFLIKLSATTQGVESLYFTLFFGALYIVIHALDQPTLGRWCLVGLMLGFAYLARPEAFLTLAVAVVAVMASRNATLRVRLLCGLAAIFVFFLLASPYVAFLYRTTGQLRLEGKGPAHFILGKRMLEGQSFLEANYSINDKLEGTGLFMRPVVDLVRETHLEPGEIFRLVVTAIPYNAYRLFGYLASDWLGTQVLFGLAMMGIFHRPWRGRKRLAHLFILLAIGASLAAPLSTHNPNIRYAFILVPFLLIWAGDGLMQIFRWAKITALGVSNPNMPCNIYGGVAVAIICGLVFLFSFMGAVGFGASEQATLQRRMVKDTSAWIRGQQDNLVTIMDTSTAVAFNAGALWIHFPYTTPELAVRYLDTAKVDYVVLSRRDADQGYLRDWYEHGIPDTRAEFVYQTSKPYYFRVYRWHRAND